MVQHKITGETFVVDPETMTATSPLATNELDADLEDYQLDHNMDEWHSDEWQVVRGAEIEASGRIAVQVTIANEIIDAINALDAETCAGVARVEADIALEDSLKVEPPLDPESEKALASYLSQARAMRLIK